MPTGRGVQTGAFVRVERSELEFWLGDVVWCRDAKPRVGVPAKAQDVVLPVNSAGCDRNGAGCLWRLERRRLSAGR